MILLVHNHKTVAEVLDVETNLSIEVSFQKPIEELFRLAEDYSDSILVWCHESQKNNLDIVGIKSSFTLKNMMVSFSNHHYLPEQIGYVDNSSFLKVNRNVKYPTWLMSSNVGAIHASQLIKFKSLILTNATLDYSLSSIAKLGMPNGLFCYSIPKLLKNNLLEEKQKKASRVTLFKFVKQHFKTRWVWLLLLNYVWHDKRIPLYSALRSLFYKKIASPETFELEPISDNVSNETDTIDIIIPTIGRKQYLHDVLKYLSVQTLMPNKVVIVEQNPDKSSASELDFIKTENWPFEIKHFFIHQTGACNARNMALKEVTSKFVYLADDDNEFGKNLLQDVVDTMNKYSLEAVSMSYLQKDEKELFTKPIQWSAFGAGSSIIKSKYLEEVGFNMALEHGYGEDVEFGMQLRNQGADIIYFPDIKILHLKAPMGGFRTKFIHPWEQDVIQPKPSPTVMLNKLNNTTRHQFLGYKTILFFKFYNNQNIKNPITYYSKFKKQWKQSVYWANKLNQQSD